MGRGQSTEDLFTKVVGGRRGAETADRALPDEGHYSYFKGPSGALLVTSREILEALEGFDDQTPLHFTKFSDADELLLDEAERLVGLHVPMHAEGPLVFSIAPSTAPAYPTLGDFKRLLEEHIDSKRRVTFKPPAGTPRMDETLVGYRVFSGRRGKKYLALVTVW